MNNKIQFSSVCCLTMLLFAIMVGGCTRNQDAVLPPPVWDESAPKFDPLMVSVRGWLESRKYVFATNVEDDVTSFQIYFADLPGDADSASCLIHSGTNGDMLTVNALLRPLAGKKQRDQVNSWVDLSNSHSQWGFYGFDVEDQQVWFRISLFRPTGKAGLGDMDRLVSEVAGAIHEWRDFVENHDIMENPVSARNSSNPPEDPLSGIQREKPVAAPQKSRLINFVKPVNYVRLNDKKK
jgi:hypothetical protein